MQLLYGPNTGQSNNACYQSPQFDENYKKSRSMPDSPERNKLYREMARLMETDTPWMLADSRYRNVLQQPHVVGYKKHPVMHAEWLYIDFDPKAKQ
jgi:oligopeptide transport system substrate-binding protein